MSDTYFTDFTDRDDRKRWTNVGGKWEDQNKRYVRCFLCSSGVSQKQSKREYPICAGCNRNSSESGWARTTHLTLKKSLKNSFSTRLNNYTGIVVTLACLLKHYTTVYFINIQ